MKKLSLKKLNLESNDMLQREQLKSVFGGGGYGCGQCAVIYPHHFVRCYSLPDCGGFFWGCMDPGECETYGE